MEKYRHFNVASYLYAYDAEKLSDAEIRRGVEQYLRYLPLNKVYVENHRAKSDVPVSRLCQIKALLEEYGLTVSGGITSTALVGKEQKPSLFDTFCYTDPAHKAEYLRIVREAASVFDEIILDDYFFASCRCEKCIEAKGSLSWSAFRQRQMREFSREIVREAKKIRPGLRFIIKYPNWYESHHASGYNPEIQRDIFDLIYTGTETREPFYASQHLQRYASYGILRLLENTAPGRNGGGWIDLGGSSDNLNRFLEQAEFTLLAGAKELTLFNFSSLLPSPALPALDSVLRRVDSFLEGRELPTGTPVWEPFDADGEDQLCAYLGMCGLQLEPMPDFPVDAPAVLFTQRTACIPEAVDMLEAYVRRGGKAIVTTGFLRQTYDRGICDMTSVRLTHRHFLGKEYMIDRCDWNYSDIRYAKGSEPVLFEMLDYKTNATWADILVLSGENNAPLLTSDFYGKGRLLILNGPENFSDLYRLPREVIQVLNAELSAGQSAYLASEPKMSLIAYRDHHVCVHSFRPMQSIARLIVRGDCLGVRDCETGTFFPPSAALEPPQHRGDAAMTRNAVKETVFAFPIRPGQSLYLEILFPS